MSDNKGEAIGRRQVLAAGAIGAATVAGLLGPEGDPQAAPRAVPQARQPVVYLPHGGGPWPFVDIGMGNKAQWDALAQYLRGLRGLPKVAPKALLVISAHWEEAVPTLMTAAHPPMLYDYYGFPPASYQVQWPAPGHPQLATRVRALLTAAGISSGVDASRGFDHGTFVPLKLTYPDAELPTLQLSLKRGLDPAEHLAIGRALQPLRDEGVFIVGSGMSYHNMRGFGDPRSGPASLAFDSWLQATIALPQPERDQRLANWTQAPSARAVHPREEHLLPLMVIAGAAGADRGTAGYAAQLMGVQILSAQFGA